ncbi:hypothetical protein C8250_042180 [Streptomyces sp. So13.3]|uniref:hypothetical protein n=1 Tax=Streptomyces TaxID=1883 RepID=UPI00164D39A5|nr:MULTISPECIES: hypothetical protein [Streptomyces]MCZ4102081.1 hypothetical protein [Streptomyces sp. H39-C1]QNA77525.1 hypothetical protein C8250_042180 [Streptomyces sp. So13.3]
MLLTYFGQTLRGVSVVLGLRVREQFLDPVVRGQRIGDLVATVDRGDVPGTQQGDRVIGAVLAFPDRGKQGERSVGVEAAAAPRRVASVVGRDPGGQQRGGEESVFDDGAQQLECLGATVVAGEQAPHEGEGHPVAGLRARGRRRWGRA